MRMKRKSPGRQEPACKRRRMNREESDVTIGLFFLKAEERCMRIGKVKKELEKDNLRIVRR